MPVAVERRPAGVCQPRGGRRDRRQVGAVDVVAGEHVAIVLAPVSPPRRCSSTSAGGNGSCRPSMKHLAIRRKPEQVAAFVVAVVQVIGALSKRGEIAGRHRRPAQLGNLVPVRPRDRSPRRPPTPPSSPSGSEPDAHRSRRRPAAGARRRSDVKAGAAIIRNGPTCPDGGESPSAAGPARTRRGSARQATPESRRRFRKSAVAEGAAITQNGSIGTAPSRAAGATRRVG